MTDIYFGDSLQNVVANLGTARDKASHSVYVDRFQSFHELLVLYRNSWLARATVDYIAEDATRKWRVWRAKDDLISKIEQVEKRLQLQKTVQDALVAARLYGGAAIYINIEGEQPWEELDPSKIKRIDSLAIMTPNTITPMGRSKDIRSPFYGKPETYRLMNTKNGGQVTVHASRLVVFEGVGIPDDVASISATSGWGDSILKSAFDPIMRYDSAMANVNSLLYEAKIDVLKFQGFARLAAEQPDLVSKRLHLQAAMKGINGTLVIDAQDEYEQKSASFAGITDVIGKMQDDVAGASGMPVTRLFGRAAVGLSGSGDGDERVYYDRVTHLQKTEVSPAMHVLDNCIEKEATGTISDAVWYEWTPLRQLTEKERVDIFATTAKAARDLAGGQSGAIVPINALSDGVVSALTEQGALPALEEAIIKYGAMSEQDDL